MGAYSAPRVDLDMVLSNSDRLDWYGWVASLLHWITLYILIGPADGKIKKDDVKALYDVCDL